jgi:hypothetical protein
VKHTQNSICNLSTLAVWRTRCPGCIRRRDGQVISAVCRHAQVFCVSLVRRTRLMASAK